MKFGCCIGPLDFDHALERRQQEMEGRHMTIGTIDRIALGATFAAALLILAALGMTETAETQHARAAVSLRLRPTVGERVPGPRRRAPIESVTHGRH
jgi:hypothetical protein